MHRSAELHQPSVHFARSGRAYRHGIRAEIHGPWNSGRPCREQQALVDEHVRRYSAAMLAMNRMFVSATRRFSAPVSTSTTKSAPPDRRAAVRRISTISARTSSSRRCAAAPARGRGPGGAQAHQGEHDREAAAESPRPAELQHQLLYRQQEGRARRRRDVQQRRSRHVRGLRREGRPAGEARAAARGHGDELERALSRSVESAAGLQPHARAPSAR